MPVHTLVRIGRLMLIALLALAITAAFFAAPFPGLTIPESLLRA
jgi:hypothetical protein